MNLISFMSANYVARCLDYHMTEGWGQGDSATQAWFEPIATYGARFEALLKDVRAMGFSAIDIWGAHLNPGWATPAHIDIARSLLSQYGLTPVSLAGWWDTLEAFEGSCRIAAGIGAPVLGGGGTLIETQRDGMIALLKQYGRIYGIENHPEKTPDEVLRKIGDSDVLGVAIDTGWFGTQGYDAAAAVAQMADRIVHVHLKDVKAVGAHETCRFGDGIVPLQGCVQTLLQHGYTGAFSIEHEPETFDPTQDVIDSLHTLQQWLN